MATVFLSVYGKEGLRELAVQNLSKAHHLRGQTQSRVSADHSSANSSCAMDCRKPSQHINGELEAKKIIGGLALEKFYPELKNTMLLCCTEMSKKTHMDQLAEAFA